MKKSIFKFLIFSLFIFILSCKKNNSNNNNELNNNNSITEWLKKESTNKTTFRNAVVKSVIENLDWQNKLENKLNEDVKITIIPISAGFKNDNNSDKNVFNYLVIYENKKSNNIVGHIYQYVNSNNDFNFTQVENSILAIITKNNATVNGQYTVLSIADVFDKELYYKENNLEKIRYVTQKNNARESATAHCIDWYWITYNASTGEIYAEEYVFTTCDCPYPRTNPYSNRMADPDDCSNGGGGNVDMTCSVNFNNLVNSSYPTPNTGSVNTYSSSYFENGIEKRSWETEWQFHSSPLGWRWFSDEKGTHKKINNKWYWSTFQHVKEKFVGVLIGGSAELKNVTTDAYMETMVAGMVLDYSITYSLVCNGSPLSTTLAYTSDNSWFSNP